MAHMKQALVEAEFTTDLPLQEDCLPASNNPIPSPNLTPSNGPPLIDSRSSVELDFEPGTVHPMASFGTGITVHADPVLPERRPILLLIEDIRGPVASSSEIVDNLQASISAFEGPARIGIQDEVHPTYVQFFGTIVGPDSDNQAPHESVLLNLPADGRLHLTVASIGGVRINVPTKRLRSVSPANTLDEQLESSATRSDLPAASTSKKTKTQPTLTEAELAWLSGKLKATPGHDRFQANRNQRLSNLDRMRYWKFAAQFDAKYYKVQWPAEVSTVSLL
ncbi:hypothetical protein C8R46DRAFT_1219702 [Mycena filopes]|nr:hypothetical protein C8R46DRAFT_1219702 [Mycena filopes]